MKFKSIVLASALAVTAFSAQAANAPPLFTLVCHGEDATATGDDLKKIDLSITLYKQTPFVARFSLGEGRGGETSDIEYYPAKDGGVLKARYTPVKPDKTVKPVVQPIRN